MQSKASLLRKYNRAIKKSTIEPEKALELIDNLYGNKLLTQARLIFQKLIDIEPIYLDHYYENGATNFGISLLLKKRNDLKEEQLSIAINILEKARSITPNNPKIYPTLAYAYLEKEKLTKADYILSLMPLKRVNEISDKSERSKLIDDYNRTSKILSYEYYLKFGYSNFKKRKYRDAIKGFKKALKHYRDNFESYFYLAICYLFFDQRNNAINCLSKCLELSPDIPEVYFWLGTAYKLEGEFEKASSFYERCFSILKKDEQNKEFRNLAKANYNFNLGLMFWQKGVFEEAKKYFKRIIFNKDKFGNFRKNTIRLYPSLVDIDKELSFLHISEDLRELAKKVDSLYIKITKLVKDPKKIKDDKIITPLFIIKYYTIFNLELSLNAKEAQIFKDKMKKTLGEKLYLENVKGEFGLGFSTRELKKLNMTDSIRALEGVRNFIKEIKLYDDPYVLPISKQKKIIKDLGLNLKYLDGCTSIEFSQKLMHENLLGKFEEILEKYTKPIRTGTKGILAELTEGRRKKESEIKILSKKGLISEDEIIKTLKMMFTEGIPKDRIDEEIMKKISFVPEGAEKYTVYYTGRKNKFDCPEETVNKLIQNAENFNIQIFFDYKGEFLVQGKVVDINPTQRRGLRCFLTRVGKLVGFATIGYEAWGKEDTSSGSIHGLKSNIVMLTNDILDEYFITKKEKYLVRAGFTFCFIDS